MVQGAYIQNVTMNISIRCTNLDAWKIQSKLMSLLASVKGKLFRITIPDRGCSSFIYCKAWIHESESVKLKVFG